MSNYNHRRPGPTTSPTTYTQSQARMQHSSSTSKAPATMQRTQSHTQPLVQHPSSTSKAPATMQRTQSTTQPLVQHPSSTSKAPATQRTQSKTQPPQHSTSANKAPAKSTMQRTQSQMDTRYVNMLLALDGIPRKDNLMASFFTWILLAGFVLFPGTFTSLQNVGANLTNEQEAQHILSAVEHVSLFVIAFVCCGIGTMGMCYLWWRWSQNYIWLTNRIFLPGCLNSIAGMLSTIANVYGVQHGEFSATSKVTMIVTGVVAFVCGVLFLFYSLWKLRLVKREHDRQIGKERAGKHGEGLVEQLKRKANEKEPEPGMV